MEKRPHLNSAWHEPTMRGESKTVQGKNSRHGSEMGVFSEQLENPGFKVPMLFGLFLIRGFPIAI